MAKAIKIFIGTDTFGRGVEVAQRADGVYFERHQFDNGRYGLSTTRWSVHEPSFITEGVNAYSGEPFKYESPVMTWGFQNLREFDNSNGEYNVRLPN